MAMLVIQSCFGSDGFNCLRSNNNNNKQSDDRVLKMFSPS